MTIVKRQMALHNTVSVIGGFFGGYTVVNHCDIIANAQTGNLMRLVVQACRGNLDSIGFIILAFLIYAAANVFYAVARRYMKISMKIVSFIVTAAVIVLTGLLTGADNDYLAILPVFFFAPVQWNAFKKAGGNSSATIFSSNNVRQAVLLLTKYFMDKDKKALVLLRWRGNEHPAEHGVRRKQRVVLFSAAGRFGVCLRSLSVSKAQSVRSIKQDRGEVP